jgi:hypothetical protein
MQIPALAVVAITLGLWGLAAYWVFYAIPAAIRSMYRYKFWKIRDEFVDGMLAGTISDTEKSRRILERMESAILFAESFTPARILTAVLVCRAATKLREAAKDLRTEEPEPAADAVYARFNKVGARCFLFSSPSGWVVWLLCKFIIFPIAKLSGRARALKCSMSTAIADLMDFMSTNGPKHRGNGHLAHAF